MWRTLFFVALWMGAGLAFTEATAYGLQYWRVSLHQSPHGSVPQTATKD